MIKLEFFIKKSSVQQEEELIFLRFVIENKLFSFPTGLSVPEKAWDKNRQEMNKTFPNSWLTNAKLAIITKITQDYLLGKKSFERENLGELKEEISNVLKTLKQPEEVYSYCMKNEIIEGH